jgi:hypothetical protein
MRKRTLMISGADPVEAADGGRDDGGQLRVQDLRAGVDHRRQREEDQTGLLIIKSSEA